MYNTDRDQQTPGDNSDKERKKSWKWILVKGLIFAARLIWKLVNFLLNEE